MSLRIVVNVTQHKPGSLFKTLIFCFVFFFFCCCLFCSSYARTFQMMYCNVHRLDTFALLLRVQGFAQKKHFDGSTSKVITEGITLWVVFSKILVFFYICHLRFDFSAIGIYYFYKQMKQTLFSADLKISRNISLKRWTLEPGNRLFMTQVSQTAQRLSQIAGQQCLFTVPIDLARCLCWCPVLCRSQGAS